MQYSAHLMGCKARTCFVAHALAPGRKVKCLPDSQFWLMDIVLINISSCMCCSELIKALSIVGDAATHLESEADLYSIVVITD